MNYGTIDRRTGFYRVNAGFSADDEDAGRTGYGSGWGNRDLCYRWMAAVI